MRTVLAAFVFFLALPAFAQQADVDAARRTLAAVEKLLEQRPNDAVLWFFLARFRAELEDRAGSVAALGKVAELGDGFLPTRQNGFDKVWDYPPFQAARDKLEAKLPRLDFAPNAFQFQDRTLLPEGIAHDPHSRAFFVGSITQRRVLRVVEGEGLSEFAGIDAKLDAVLGLAVDAPRRLLYVVSTSALTEAGEKSLRNAVVAFNIDTRKLVSRYDVPAARQLNDVAIAPGGRVFASDSASGAIFEIAVKIGRAHV